MPRFGVETPEPHCLADALHLCRSILANSLMARPATQNDGAAMANDSEARPGGRGLRVDLVEAFMEAACEAKRADAGTVTQHNMNLIIRPPDPDARRGRLTKMHGVR